MLHESKIENSGTAVKTAASAQRQEAIAARAGLMHLQKWGGFSALYEAAAYIVGMVFFILIVDYSSVVDPAQKVALMAGNQAAMYLMNLIIYVIFGAFLVVLALALYERLRSAAPGMMAVATALGLIWAGLVIAAGMVSNIGAGAVIDLHSQDPAQAATVWLAVDAVISGIGGGNEIIGGLWTLLVSWAALRGGVFPRALNYLGLVVGVAGVISAVPALGEISGMVFGLGQIIWFAWLGVAMLRGSRNAAAEKTGVSQPQFGTTS
jgi:hypothetical protein